MRRWYIQGQGLQDGVIAITALHPKMTLEHLGFIPQFLDSNDPRPIKEQFDEHYVSGWNQMRGMTMHKGWVLRYPGDPPFKPIAKIELEGRKEFVLFYDHEIVAIVQDDGSYEVARMD